MLSKTASAILAAAVLAGCTAPPYTPTPLATNFPTSEQSKLQAAAHWGAIAQHLEKRLVEEMKKGPQRPFFIHENPQATPFQRALTTQIISSLVNDGYVVSRTPGGALRIDLDVQALTFSAERAQYRPSFTSNLISNGVWVASQQDPTAKSRSAFAPGATPRTELIITLSVSDQYRYYARSTNAFYVADMDRGLYGIKEDLPPATAAAAAAAVAAPKLTTNFVVKGDR
ncbi:hypothetical protein [Pseudoduganella guangdongensis]|uniref:hypothetical protein n=1 Tax=Pseudoduganella guangdongensis TaxID=2692179 RepID=UPI001927B571|nr:hypothetical protein [Pseudoduganella guangdongensis]